MVNSENNQGGAATNESRSFAGCLAAAIGLAIILGVFAVMLIRQLDSASRSERVFSALCAGEDTDKVVAADIDGHGQHFVVTDRESIDFLAKAFTKLEIGTSDKRKTGHFYDLCLHLTNGECKGLRIDPYMDMTGMLIGFVWTDRWGAGDEHLYHVDFAETPPAEIKRAFAVLVQFEKDRAEKQRGRNPTPHVPVPTPPSPSATKQSPNPP
jgi:hypothetical protein